MGRATGHKPQLGQQGVTILHHVRALPNRAIRFVLKKPPEKMKQAQTSPRLVRRGNSLDNEGKKMKKLLLATTALTLSAGVAAADVALSGNARMGVVYDGNDFGFNSRLRVQFTLSGETDTGLAFGGSIRADNASDAGGGNVDTGGMTAGSVFISGDFGRLSMGDVAGAAEFIAGDLAGVGMTGLRFLNENTYLSNADRAAARYDYSIEGFTFAISADEPRDSNTASIAVGYTMDGFGAGIGYERVSSDVDHVIAYASATFEGVTAKATYGRQSGLPLARDQYGLSVSGSFDAVTVTAFGRRDFSSNTHYGLGASYDLGGGASIVGGVVRDGGGRLIGTPLAPAPKQTIADLGLSFTF